MGDDATKESIDERATGAETREPGLLLIFAAGRPAFVPLPVGAAPVELGRGLGPLAEAPDAMMSRQHARVAFTGGAFVITDLGSRNGSALDGAPIQGTVSAPSGGVLRLGHSLFLLCEHLGPHRALPLVSSDGRVEGTALRQLMQGIAQVARVSRTLFVSGESGAGKESLAQAFHRAGPRHEGPFIAVNCATIPEGLAERLLFGAVKGAFSGAADSQGYLQAAHGGTLFLDEVADLDAAVQAKLLRVLETGAVTPLGGTRPRQVQIAVCCATHRDLRALVAAGQFRADLFFRIGVPQVEVPPLRRRREEVPWLVAAAVARSGAQVGVHASLVEACLLREWPGNVRELLAEMNTAVIAALSREDRMLTAQCLGPHAGERLAAGAPSAAVVAAGPHSRAAVVAALAEAGGNVSEAARRLGLHRTQLRRLMERHGLRLR